MREKSVAPHAGAWIEMSACYAPYLEQRHVAPHAGAWIEMPMLRAHEWDDTVAPHAGAWIEIVIGIIETTFKHRSLPTRERGLKYLSRAV